MRMPLALVAVLLSTTLVGSAAAIAQPAATPQKHPDVLRVAVKAQGGGRFDFDVTIASPYDTPRRYADAFRVTGEGGVVFGERVLLHDHADEQPFTRDLHGVSIPAGVRSVVVQARDSHHGYGGKSMRVDLPGRPR
jgi:hypothetical protein